MTTFLAILGVVAAGLSAWAATKSARAADAANRASKEMADIEAARRHQELTPELDVWIEPWSPGDQDTFRLHVGLAGPIVLRGVAGLSVRIRDDRPGRARESPSFSGQVATREQVAAQVWGPLRLRPHSITSGGSVDQLGRGIVVPDGLLVGESLQFLLEKVQPPPWTISDAADAAVWWDQTVGSIVRLAFELVREDDPEPWLIPIEIDISEARGDLRLIE